MYLFVGQTLSSVSTYWIKLLILSNLCSGTLGQSIQLKCLHCVWLKVLCRHWISLLLGAGIWKYGMGVLLFSYSIYWCDGYFRYWIPLRTHIKEMILCSPPEGNSPQTESTQYYVKNPSGAVWICMKVVCPASERMVTIYCYVYSCLFSILVKQLFYYVFCCLAFYTQRQKETYIISLFPHTTKGHNFYWILNYFCLLI